MKFLLCGMLVLAISASASVTATHQKATAPPSMTLAISPPCDMADFTGPDKVSFLLLNLAEYPLAEKLGRLDPLVFRRGAMTPKLLPTTYRLPQKVYCLREFENPNARGEALLRYPKWHA